MAQSVSLALPLVFVLAVLAGDASRAQALTVEASEGAAVQLGKASVFSAEVEGGLGQVELRWDFGDGEQTEFTAGLTQVEHTYAAPGHYPVIVLARDDGGYGSATFVHTVHRPLLAGRAVSASSLVYVEARGWVCSANVDNDSVSCLDAESLEKVGEVPVFGGPVGLALAPDGKLWVVHRDDFAVAIVDLERMQVTHGFRLPYGSQPMGVVMSPLGDAAYVPLMATGKLLKLDPLSYETLGQAEVGPWPRGIAVSHDGKVVYVTRFISGEGQGEVSEVSATDLTVQRRYALLEDTTTEDTDQTGRGLANYLFSVALSPDGQEAWVPSKKDNMSRGLYRDGLALSQDNTVRPLLSVLDLTVQAEDVSARMDLDDRNLPGHVTFSPLGDYAFVSVIGSGLVEVRDVYSKKFVTALRGAGIAPMASVLVPPARLFVHAELSRSVSVFDVADILSGKDQTTRKLGEVRVVEQETLAPEVLRGKQIFYDSEDKRMTSEGYISCASCHFEGFEDGRVWEFSDRGEGLRNTTSLLGRRGMGHGPVHWTGNFDEIQDFEGAIRGGFGGLGFLDEALYGEGTRSDPLGDAKAGLSDDLDALAAYVSSLDSTPRSPFRNADGTLTAEAEQGRALFVQLACEGCHGGADFTNSVEGKRYDVGTLGEGSGSRLGGELDGLDTPTLLGLWQTAPYLHDGSAATVHDVLTTRNVGDLHGAISTLSEAQIDQLVQYLMQIDDGIPPPPLPFEEPEPPPAGGSDAGTPVAAEAGLPEESSDEPASQAAKESSCALTSASTRGHGLWLMLVLAALGARRARKLRLVAPVR